MRRRRKVDGVEWTRHWIVGRVPTITTWINDVKMFELDTSKIDLPGHDPDAAFAKLGPSGRIAFEVHDVNLQNPGESGGAAQQQDE